MQNGSTFIFPGIRRSAVKSRGEHSRYAKEARFSYICVVAFVFRIALLLLDQVGVYRVTWHFGFYSQIVGEWNFDSLLVPVRIFGSDASAAVSACYGPGNEQHGVRVFDRIAFVILRGAFHSWSGPETWASKS